MKLKEILNLLNSNNLIASVMNEAGEEVGYPKNGSDSSSIMDIEVSGITFDSREVTEGTLFVCKGVYFNESYLADSVRQGACVYVSETPYPESGKGIPGIIVNDVRKAMSLLGDMFYDHPSGKLKIVGITGTKGKTTCSHFMKAVMDEYLQAQGKRDSGIMSSNIMYDGRREVASINTTPEAMMLQRELYNMVGNGVEYCTMEVSSQGLKYGRTDGVDFDVACFLNVSKDHISPKEHSDFDDYYSSKLKIFSQARAAVIDLDDERSAETLAEAGKHVDKCITYSTMREDADLYAYDIEKSETGEGQRFKVVCNSSLLGLTDAMEFSIALMGRFNVSNALAVIAAGRLLGIPWDSIREGLKDARVGGRMEIYKSADEKIVCIVDYAHNHLSFTALVDSVVEEYPDRKDNIIAIFGADGGKALDRREELGRIAGKRTAKAIITADHPGPESFDQIAEDIAQYIRDEGGSYDICEIRTDAIRKAINEVKEPSVILIMGHGTQANQYYWGKYYPAIPDTESAEVWLAEYDRQQAKKQNEG